MNHKKHSWQITIDDSAEVEKVTAATMTKEADKVYSYIYQSDATNDDDGNYVITIEAVLGNYTVVTQEKMTLVEEE